MTIIELLENYDNLNEDVENKFKSITSKIRNTALASMLAMSLLLSACTPAQKQAVSDAYDKAKNKVEQMDIPGKASDAYNTSKDFLGKTYNTTKDKIKQSIEDADIPGKILSVGDKIDDADEATGDWIKEKYGSRLEKEMEGLSDFQKAIIKAKLIAYAGKLGLTKADSFETTKAIMFVNYWRKLIKEAKKGDLKESILNEDVTPALAMYWNKSGKYKAKEYKETAIHRAKGIMGLYVKIYKNDFTELPRPAKETISEALAILEDSGDKEYEKWKKVFAGVKLPEPIKKGIRRFPDPIFG